MAKKVSASKSLKKQRHKRNKMLRLWTIRIGIAILIIVFLLFFVVAFFTPPRAI